MILLKWQVVNEEMAIPVCSLKDGQSRNQFRDQ